MRIVCLILLMAQMSMGWTFIPYIVHDPAQTKAEAIKFAEQLDAWKKQHGQLLKEIGLETEVLGFKEKLLEELGNPMDAQLKLAKAHELVESLNDLVAIEDKEVLDNAANGISAITRSDGIFEPLPQYIEDSQGNRIPIKRQEVKYRNHAILQRRIDQYNVERKVAEDYTNRMQEHSSEVVKRMGTTQNESEYWAAKTELSALRLQNRLMHMRLMIRYEDMKLQSALNQDMALMQKQSALDYKGAVTLGGANLDDKDFGTSGIDYGEYSDVYGGTGGYDFSSGGGYIQDGYTEPSSGVEISKEAIELIIEFEVGGVSYYNSVLSKPTDPGGASGVTIGIGYDLGYNTPAQIHRDWGDLLEPSILERLVAVAGMKGESVNPGLISSLSDIRISYEAAATVFQRNTLPRFAKLAQGAFPLMEKLHPHSQGALVSLVFNRGSSLSGDRRLEMRQIRQAILDGQPEKVPQYFRDMKRLWEGKGLPGLLRRREAEAALFQLGLNASVDAAIFKFRNAA